MSNKVLTGKEIEDAMRAFLREYPLHRKLKLRAEQATASIPHHATFWCSCSDEPSTTWHLWNTSPSYPTEHLSRNEGSLYYDFGTFYVYRCSLCNDKTRAFWTKQSNSEKDLDGTSYFEIKLWKIGQSPPASTTPSKPIRKALSEEQLEFYRKGIISIENGFGLGAVAYLRRLIEDAGELFLNLIEEAGLLEEDQELITKVQDARSNTAVKSTLKAASELLPKSLKPGGINPLARMYRHLSGGLHDASDAECQHIAADLRHSFDYVFETMSEQLAKAHEIRTFWQDSL